MPRIVSTDFNEGFYAKRDALLGAARSRAILEEVDLRHVGAWLDRRFPEELAREIWEGRQRSVVVDSLLQWALLHRQVPDAEELQPTGAQGDALQVIQLGLAFDHLHKQNQSHDENWNRSLERLLSRGLPLLRREKNAHRAVVVTGCILDPDAGEWLGSVTPLATSLWESDFSSDRWVFGRVTLCKEWGRHQALAMLDEACDILEWKSPQAPPSGPADNNRTAEGWTKSELVLAAKDAIGSFSSTSFDRIRDRAGVPARRSGGRGQSHPFSKAEVEQLIKEVGTGSYQRRAEIAACWRELVDKWLGGESPTSPH